MLFTSEIAYWKIQEDTGKAAGHGHFIKIRLLVTGLFHEHASCLQLVHIV